jgi:hypothetical protein
VDTEGNDFFVLKGLGDWLCPDRISVLYVELGRDREAACRLLSEHGYQGFVFQPLASAVRLRRAVRRMAEGEPVALYQPLEVCGGRGAETLWCRGGGPEEASLRELAARSAEGT